MNITLHWSWLKYDIDQETQKAAKCLITNDPSGEIQMEAQTADDTFDADYCRRKIFEACMKLQDILHRYFIDFRYEKANTRLAMHLLACLRSGSSAQYGYTFLLDDSNLLLVTKSDDGTPFDQFSPLFRKTDYHDKYTVEVSADNGSLSNLSYVFEGDSQDKLEYNAIAWHIKLDNFGPRRNVSPTLLAQELHQYVVLYVLQEWTKLTHPAIEPNYVNRLNAEELRIRSIVNRKEAPSRPS